MLIDVSRLLWRTLAGRRPTGIDRVCLAYLRQFGGAPGARALFHWRRVRWVMPGWLSQRVFGWLLQGRPMAVPGALPEAALFVGHTGLQWQGFADWALRLASGRRGVGAAPALVFIHDLIPLTHPQYSRSGQAAVHARRLRQALQAAHGLVVNSQHTAEELAAFAARERLLLPPLCVAHLAPVVDLAHEPAAAPLPGPYFVVLGTVEARKNHALLLDLWDRWAAERAVGNELPMLVVIGQPGWEAASTLARLQAGAAHLRWLPDADDAQVAAYLRHATALLMPSFAEGYGLPLAEALALGTPAIVSDLPALREVGGEVPLYLAANDAQGWYEAVRGYAVPGEAGPREAQRQRLLAWQAPTWEAHFQRVGAFLRQHWPGRA